MTSSWHSRLRNELLIFGCAYSILIGTLSYIVDYSDRRIVHKKWFRIWAYIMNIIIMGSIPVLAHLVSNKVTSLESNWLMLHTDYVLGGVRLVLVTLIILLRRQRERVLLQSTKILFAMDARYAQLLQPVPALDKKLNYMYIIKHITTVLQSVITFTTTLFIIREITWEGLLVAVYLANVQNVIHSTLFQFFTSLMHLQSRFLYLNRQLKLLQRSLRFSNDKIGRHRRRQHIYAMKQLRDMSRAHFMLTILAQRLTDCLKYTALGALLGFLLQHVIFGYYGLMLLGRADIYLFMSSITVAVGGFFYFLLHVDLYIFFWNCEATTAAHHRTGQLLRLYHQLPQLSPGLARQLELFSLQLAQSQFQINAGGMFTLNNASALALSAYILHTILILVQYDFENRIKTLRNQLDLKWKAEIEDFIME